MPTASQHKGKADHNRAFLATIPLDRFPDWAAVAAFYTALHGVERLRAANGHGDSTGHEDRLTYVQSNHRAIHSPYQLLQSVSMLARYESNAVFYAQFQPDDVRTRLIDRYLAAIEAYVAARLGA